MNVFYEYGAPNTGNQSGRLIRQQDASGVQTFEYGNMGELIKNIHTFVVPGGLPYTFQTQWEYDSWNRIKSIQYPDGEILFSFPLHHTTTTRTAFSQSGHINTHVRRAWIKNSTQQIKPCRGEIMKNWKRG